MGIIKRMLRASYIGILANHVLESYKMPSIQVDFGNYAILFLP